MMRSEGQSAHGRGDGRDSRVAVVGEEQRVVAQGRHGQADLLQVEEVLHDGHLAQQDAVRDRVTREEGRRQVVRVSGLARVRPQDKRVVAARLAPGVLGGGDKGEETRVSLRCCHVICARAARGEGEVERTRVPMLAYM